MTFDKQSSGGRRICVEPASNRNRIVFVTTALGPRPSLPHCTAQMTLVHRFTPVAYIIIGLIISSTANQVGGKSCGDAQPCEPSYRIANWREKWDPRYFNKVSAYRPNSYTVAELSSLWNPASSREAQIRCHKMFFFHSERAVCYLFFFIMQPSPVGAGRILRCTLSVCPSVPLLLTVL